MKRKFTLLFSALITAFSVNSQVLLLEDFNDPFTPGASTPGTPGYDWVVINNSSPTGNVSWDQGNQTGGNGTLTAYNGSTDDFFMADFMSIPFGQSGGISAFLITPTLTIYNGAELKFATRTLNQPSTLFPDRMQVLMSTTGNTASVAGNTTNVGSFTNTLLTINPNLSTSTSGAVVNGSVVNGYPQVWTVYTLPITGVTGTVTGRFAFRYYVNNGGSTGANSRLVAVDAVRYTLPCGPTIQSYTTCANANTTLTALNGVAVTTYSWNTGATTNTVVVNPNTTTIYTLFPSINGTLSCGTSQTATVTVSNQLSMLVSASETTVCAGDPVILTATSSAQTFSWVNGSTSVGTSSMITINPTVSATYSVGGLSGTLPNFCVGGNTIAITVNPNPTITAGTANTLICTTGASVAVNFTATGALGYNWFDDDGIFTGTSTSQPFAAPIPTINAPTNFSVYVEGIDANGCFDFIAVPYSVAMKPTITATVSKSPTCINTTVEIVAEGADTYTWTGPISGSSDAISFATGTVTGNRTFTIVGTNTDGCKNTKLISVNVNPCTGIEKVEGDNSASYIFPNPFANQLNVSGLSGRVVISNSLGQAVVTKDVDGSDASIDTSVLPRGAYILSAYDKNGLNIKTIKVVKN